MSWTRGKYTDLRTDQDIVSAADLKRGHDNEPTQFSCQLALVYGQAAFFQTT
jgi:hypothetical protein